jgi:hypothetical protein
MSEQIAADAVINALRDLVNVMQQTRYDGVDNIRFTSFVRTENGMKYIADISIRLCSDVKQENNYLLESDRLEDPQLEFDESHICKECGGLLYRDDAELPQYAGYCHCNCHQGILNQVAKERLIKNRI